MRAFHEASRHEDAAEAGERARSRDPHSLRGVEVMSTSLWHLRDKVRRVAGRGGGLAHP